MQDLNAMIDAAKYADLVLLLVDGAFGFEMETFEFLNILQARPECSLPSFIQWNRNIWDDLLNEQTRPLQASGCVRVQSCPLTMCRSCEDA